MIESDREFVERMEKLARAIKVWTAILALIVLSLEDIHQTLIKVVEMLQ